MGPTKKFLRLRVGYCIADLGGKKNANVDANVNAKSYVALGFRTKGE